MIIYLILWYLSTKQIDTVSSIHIFEKTGTVHVMGSYRKMINWKYPVDVIHQKNQFFILNYEFIGLDSSN